MTPETLKEANVISDEIESLEEHLSLLRRQENNIHGSTPLALLNISGSWTVTLKKEYLNITDVLLLYEKRITERLEHLKLRLEAL